MHGSLPVKDSPARIARLILEAREGCNEALGQLMAFSRQYLLLIADEELPAELQAKGDAADLVQDTQIEALRGFEGFRGQTAAELLGWLREILLNNMRDFNRHYRGVAKRRISREISLSGPSGPYFQERLLADQPPPGSRLNQREQARALAQALEQLDEDQRNVVRWRHHDGLSFEQISQRMGRSVQAVRKTWSRALRKLEQKLPNG